MEDRYQDEIEQILEQRPGRFLRNAGGFLLLFFLLLLLPSFFIRYSDVIEAPILLLKERPALQLTSQHSGRAETLYFAAGDTVAKGDLLLAFESAFAPEALSELEMWIADYEKNGQTKDLLKEVPFDEKAGLQGLLERYGHFMRDNTAFQKNEIYQKQIEILEQLTGSMEQEQSTLKEIADIYEKKYLRDLELKGIGGVSEEDLERSKEEWLAKKTLEQRMESELLDRQMQIQQIRLLLPENEKLYADRKNSLTTKIREQIRILKNRIQQHKEAYYLYAPKGGVIDYTNLIQAGTYLTAGEAVCSILPLAEDQGDEVLGRMKVSGSGLGKIEIGQEVDIRLAAYPYQEFGALRGRVSSISPTSDEQGIPAMVELPEGLKTNTGEQLSFRTDLYGTARIVTRKRSLADRVFAKLRAAVDRL